MSEPIIVRLENSIAHIVLNRPQKLNSLSIDLIEALTKTLTSMEKNDEVKVIMLSGEGKAFCAGGDLDTMKGLTESINIFKYMEAATNLTKLMLNLDKYVISAVHGFVAGAGFSIALASDFIVADHSAKFGLSFVNVGLIPDLGLMKLLSKRLPIGLAKEWIVSGKVVTAEEAKTWGIINRIAEKDLLEETIAFSQLVLQGPPVSNKFVKYMLNHAVESNWESVWMQENMIQTFLLQTKDHQEGLQAFFEKRVPEFKGN